MNKLNDAKETVLGVLRGELSKESAPHVFEDDLLFFAVGLVEEKEADWLLQVLKQESYDKSVRRLVASSASAEIRGQLSASLG